MICLFVYFCPRITLQVNMLTGCRIFHRIIESQWFGLKACIKDHLIPCPLPEAGAPLTRPSCSKPQPTWPWMLPGMMHPQLAFLFVFSVIWIIILNFWFSSYARWVLWILSVVYSGMIIIYSLVLQQFLSIKIILFSFTCTISLNIDKVWRLIAFVSNIFDDKVSGYLWFFQMQSNRD